jgi:hypothetical protein
MGKTEAQQEKYHMDIGLAFRTSCVGFDLR